MQGLSEIVPDSEYRNTFLKLTRNLAPNGKVCGQLDIRSADGSHAVRLDPEVRNNITNAIRTVDPATHTSEFPRRSLTGVLRAVHLDMDWLEVVSDNDEKHRVTAVHEQVDDVIGTMMNKPVIVHVVVERSSLKFVDIEPDD